MEKDHADFGCSCHVFADRVLQGETADGLSMDQLRKDFGKLCAHNEHIVIPCNAARSSDGLTAGSCTYVVLLSLYLFVKLCNFVGLCWVAYIMRRARTV
jgi:hypothetical protein